MLPYLSINSLTRHYSVDRGFTQGDDDIEVEEHGISAGHHRFTRQREPDDQDLKELKGGNHNLAHPPSNYTLTNSRRERDARRQRIQHISRRRP